MSAVQHIEQTAARWLIRREEPEWSDTDQVALDAWLEEAMAHKAAYWRLEHGWRQADRIRALGDAAAPPYRPLSESWIARAWRPVAIAASIALVFIAVSTQVAGPVRDEAPYQTIATQVGGRKIVPLSDGSRIELNTATLIRASVTEERREVWLDQGEAYFEVRHSDRIPFVVHAGSRTVTVLGTKFSVRRDRDRVTVSVVEGRVRVDDASKGAAAASSTITTGNVAIAQGGSLLVTTRSPERVESGLAWRDGMLTFDQSRLDEVAVEFNRYNARKLVIADPEVASIRIGGTFRASNIDAFVRLLRDAYGLEVRVNDREVTISN